MSSNQCAKCEGASPKLKDIQFATIDDNEKPAHSYISEAGLMGMFGILALNILLKKLLILFELRFRGVSTVPLPYFPAITDVLATDRSLKACR